MYIMRKSKCFFFLTCKILAKPGILLHVCVIRVQFIATGLLI